jgi:hypothetical protein
MLKIRSWAQRHQPVILKRSEGSGTELQSHVALVVRVDPSEYLRMTLFE